MFYVLLTFNLVRFFGDVPLVINEIKIQTGVYTHLRESTRTIFDQTARELTDVIAILPSLAAIEIDGRATKRAAQGWLGKVYVTQHPFEKALPILEDLIGVVITGYWASDMRCTHTKLTPQGLPTHPIQKNKFKS